MKTSNERTNSIKQKVTAKRRNRTVIFTSAATACVLIALTVICSLPILGPSVPPINAYKKDAYYPLIEKINSRYQDNEYSIFENLGFLGAATEGGETSAPPTTPTSPDEVVNPGSDNNSANNKYEETTLNQVDGIIEGDILKRSSTHAFYLRKTGTVNTDVQCLALDVYRLAGSDTEKVTEYCVLMKDDTTLTYSKSSSEMFLSEDATRATVITACKKQGVTYTAVISLDITNPEAITEVNRVYVSGSYLSGRKVDGKLLIVTNFNLYGYRYYDSTGDAIDYDKKETYVPRCGAMSDDGLIPINDIYIPDNCPDLNYTVLASLEEMSLEVTSKYAVFSYSQDVAVFEDKLVVMRNVYYNYKDFVKYGNEVSINTGAYGEGSPYIQAHMSELVVLNYVDIFEKVGAIGLDGDVKDRYSLDVKDNVLRVFTTIRHTSRRSLTTATNVSLYCVDLAAMQTIASKERFAPSGDEVKSVRYDGDTAYVCTARRNTDPVFCFDLSDLNNITYVDTGEIDGFSHNLIKFGDLLLGIGQGVSSGVLKVEVYKQTDDAEAENGVVSVGKYEMLCSFSAEHKAHFVNAEHNLVGLQVYFWANDLVSNKPQQNDFRNYCLLRYDEATQQFVEVYFDAFECHVDLARAFYEHDGVYVFGENGCTFIDLQENA